jgi:hypothetical protein
MGEDNSLVGGGLPEAAAGDGLAVTDARSEPLPAEGTENFLVPRMDEHCLMPVARS